MKTFFKKLIKKRATKLHVAILVCAFLVVGGGIAYKAMALTGITVIAPIAGEYWSGTQEIIWDADCTTISDVNIFWGHGGTVGSPTQQTLIASGVSCDDYSYSWDTTSTNFDGDEFVIRIEDASITSTFDYSGGFFTIDNTAPEFTVSEDTDTGPVQTDIINVTINDTNTITVSKYGFSENNICDADDTYDNPFISGDDFNIVGDNTDYLCVMATDEVGNTGYNTVGQLNTDNTAPVFTAVNIGDEDIFYKAGDTISFSVNLEEIDLDVTVNLKVLDTVLTETFLLTYTENGIYTGTTGALSSVTMVEGTNIAVTVTATDIAGNVATDSSLGLTIDKTDPTVVITSTEIDPTNADPIPVTITFNEEVVGFEVGDITVTNGSVIGNSLSSDDNKVFTVDIAPTNDGDVTVIVAADKATDLAGNGNVVSNTFSIIYDGTAPTFTVDDNVSEAWVGSDTVKFTIDYTTSGAGSAKYVLTSGTCAIGDFSGSGITYISGDTLTFNNETDNGKYLCLRADDLAGNIGYQSVGPFMIDTALASIVINEDDGVAGDYVKSDDVIFTVTYGASEAGDTGYVLITDATTCNSGNSFTGVAAYTSGNTLTFNSEADDGKYVCLRARDGKGDQDGNGYDYEMTGQLMIDNTAPTNVTNLTSTSHAASAWNKLNDIILTWTDAVDAKSGLDGYSVVCDTTAGTSPDTTKDIENGVQTHTCLDVVDGNSIYFHIRSVDILGNWSLIAEHIGPFFVDASAPTVDAGAGVIANAVFTQNAAVNADVSGVASYSWTKISGTGTITFGTVANHPEDTTISADTDGTYVINLMVVDGAGNSTSDTMTLIWDKTDPTFTIGSDGDGIDTGPVQTDTIAIAVSDANPDGATIQYGFGNTTNCTSVSYEYSFTSGNAFTIAGDHKDFLCVEYTDAANNTGYASFGPLNTDNTKPTLSPVSIVSSNTNTSLAKVGDLITLTFIADENIGTPTVTIAEHSVTPTGANTSWTATYIMTDSDTEGVIPFTINFTDIAGNAGVQVTDITGGSSVTFDRTAPTITLASATANPTNGLIAVTAKFSEIVTGFIVDDITVTGGVAETFAGTGSSYTFNVNPTDGANIAVTIEIVAGKAIDSAGNNNTASNKLTYTSDTVAPTVTAVLADTDLIVGETTTVTFTFSEDPTGFTEEDVIVIENGALSNFAVDSGNAKVYIATLTPTANVEDNTNIITVGTGWTDAAGNAPAGTTNSANYTVETLRPTVVLASATANPTNGLIAVTAKFSEIVTGFIVDDITVTGGVAETFAGTGSSYTFNVNPTDGANIAVTIEIVAGKAIDSAGNNNTASNKLTYTSDTVAPTTPTVSDPAGAITINKDAYAIAGTAKANSLVQIYKDTVVVGSQQLTGNAIDYSILVSLAQNVDNNFTVTATDAAGNESVLATVPTITEDSLAPSAPTNMTVAMNIPGTTDTISGGTGAVEGYTTVKVYSNGDLADVHLIDSMVVAENGSFGSIDIGDNAHAIVYVTATDAAGNESLPTEMTNDIVAPGVPTNLVLTDPVNDGNKTIVTIAGTGEANADIDWTISDSGSGTVTDLGTDKVGTGGIINITGIDVSGLLDGTLTLSLTLTDSAGNVSVAETDTATKDTKIPTVINVTSTANGAYTVNENIDITVEFSENVTVNTSEGTPQLQLETGNTDRQASYTGGTGTNTLTFTYTVQAGDTSSDLDYTGTGALTLNSGTIKDSVGNDASLVLANPGDAGLLGANNAIVIDTTAPADYTVSIDQVYINNSNKTAMSFTFANAELDAIYNYSINSSGGGTAISNSGIITVTNQKIENIDVGSLGDGTLTLTVILTDQAGNQENNDTDTVAKDTTAPVLAEVAPVITPTIDSTPGYVFNTTEAGAITYGGSCSSATTEASACDNEITFNQLEDGTYSDCAITVTDDAGNQSTVLLVTEFIVDTTAPDINFDNDVTPANGLTISDVTPTISAVFTEAGSGVVSNISEIINIEVKNALNETVFTTAHFVQDGTVNESGISYTPSMELEKGTYIVTVSNIKDKAGNTSAQKQWIFTVNPSSISIEVGSNETSILADGTSQAIITALVLENGSAPITGATIDFSTLYGILSGITVTDSDGKATAILTSATAGQTTVTASYNSNSGLVQDITDEITFTEVIALTATQNPGDGTEGVSASIQPYIVFSEAMDKSTLVSGNVELRIYGGINEDNEVATTLDINDEGTKVTFIPDPDLDYDTQYYFYVDAGAKSLTGKKLDPTWTSGNQSSHEFTTAVDNSICHEVEGEWECNIPLNEGWNLISLPLIPNDNAIAEVLGGLSGDVSVNVNTVKYYNSTDATTWSSYKPGQGGALTTMEDGKGYWIYMNYADTLTVNGTENPVYDSSDDAPELVSYSVVNEWNLIGFKSVENMERFDYGIHGEDVLYEWNGSSFNSNNTTMNPGFGYWLNANSSYYITPSVN